ncbi:MAG: D-alanyl-D-alanine carboxypeptidase [Oscillospiraceae bacterium]|nr:D-alanyl-D-alanine carboxypeptidase [Oscillospiraceae bacterium]
MANKQNKKKRKQLSPEMKKRRNAARAKIASFLGVVAACAAVCVFIGMGSKSEISLTIEADNYEYIGTAYDTEAPVVTDASGDVISVAETEPVVTEPADPAIAAAASIIPKLRDTYPIDMIIRSQYAIVYDVEADEVLYAKNPDEKCYPASTTKILTAATVLNNVAEDYVFTAGDELDFVNAGSSLAMLSKGCQLDTEMIIDGLMLPSGNDAAYTAAANVGRVLAGEENMLPAQSVQAFIDEMNRVAQLIGCRNTHFANPDGFHDDNHYTTVSDMLKIALYAENFDMLMESVQKTDRYVTFLTGEQISWTNSNKLLHDYSDCYYLYATGMKTGMTDQAGHCVVATAERFGHQIICIVFGAEAADIRWNDTIALLDAAFVQVRNRGD